MRSGCGPTSSPTTCAGSGWTWWASAACPPPTPRSQAGADSLRAQGVPVVMGGPHVSEEADEALEHADAVACGEADDLWPQMLADFEGGGLQRIYRTEEKPSLENYPLINWQGMGVKQFTLLPRWTYRLLRA